MSARNGASLPPVDDREIPQSPRFLVLTRWYNSANNIVMIASLAGAFMVWLASPEADFVKGKFLWANWDVEELKARKEEIQGSSLLTMTLDGWPFSNIVKLFWDRKGLTSKVLKLFHRKWFSERGSDTSTPTTFVWGARVTYEMVFLFSVKGHKCHLEITFLSSLGKLPGTYRRRIQVIPRVSSVKKFF